MGDDGLGGANERICVLLALGAIYIPSCESIRNQDMDRKKNGDARELLQARGIFQKQYSTGTVEREEAM